MNLKDCKFKNLQYILKIPKDFDERKKYPAIIFLHGAGTRGNDIGVLRGNPFFTDTADLDIPAVCFAPLCEYNSWFNIFEQLQEFAEFVAAQDFCDSSRVCLVGASMGGYATWCLAEARPELFAAIVPICGGGMYWNAQRLVHMGVWAFHGSNDKTVLPSESINMVESINNAGGNAKLTICEGVGHDSWHNAYKKEVFEWMLSHSLNKPENSDDKFRNSKQFG